MAEVEVGAKKGQWSGDAGGAEERDKGGADGDG